MFFVVQLLVLAFGIFCLFAPVKYLEFAAWLNRRSRRSWHEHRGYTTPGLRMERRWSQQTPANLWRIRMTGVAFVAMSLFVMWALGIRR